MFTLLAVLLQRFTMELFYVLHRSGNVTVLKAFPTTKYNQRKSPRVMSFIHPVNFQLLKTLIYLTAMPNKGQAAEDSTELATSATQ